jgi:hypothetical protein
MMAASAERIGMNLRFRGEIASALYRWTNDASSGKPTRQ